MENPFDWSRVVLRHWYRGFSDSLSDSFVQAGLRPVSLDLL